MNFKSIIAVLFATLAAVTAAPSKTPVFGVCTR